MHMKNPMESLCTKMWSQPIGLHLFVTTKQELGFRLQRGPAFPIQSGEGGAVRALLWVERGPSPRLLHSQQHRRAALGGRFQLSGSRAQVPAFLTQLRAAVGPQPTSEQR